MPPDDRGSRLGRRRRQRPAGLPGSARAAAPRRRRAAPRRAAAGAAPGGTPPVVPLALLDDPELPARLAASFAARAAGADPDTVNPGLSVRRAAGGSGR